MPDYLKFSDADLIARCLENDGFAWETLVRRYQGLIAGIAFKFRLSKDDSADIFQSVFTLLFQQLSNLRNQEKLSSWLITVTVRECWKFKKQDSRNSYLDDDQWTGMSELMDKEDLIDERILAIERQHMVRMAVQSLPSPCRQLIESLFYSNPQESYAEISQRLKIPVSSIGPTRGRCLVKLKDILRKNGL